MTVSIEMTVINDLTELTEEDDSYILKLVDSQDARATFEDEMWSPVEVVSSEGGGGGGEAGAEAPCGRGKHAAALLGGFVYVLGGRGAGGAVPLRDCWRYHIGSGRWERVRARGDTPPALQEHSATPHGRRIYVFGGEASLSAETPLWILDTETLLWRKLPGTGSVALRRRGRNVRPAAPTGRRGHSAHALNDCLLIYGGYKDLRGSTNELWAFHYESESWQQVRTAGAGPARHRHAAALHDARLYVHAGLCDLRVCGDLWFYDTLSRMWTQVRTPARLAPSARSGHAGLRAGAHLYIFGGEADGHPTNELWRFHFATETWERMAQSLKWPAPRVDACALLLAGVAPRVRSAPAERGAGGGAAGAGAGAGAREAPPGLLREISKLSAFHIRRAARCSYSVLGGERDSTESLEFRGGEPALAKSRSAYVIDERLPADGGESPRAGDVPPPHELAREPASVPDFADVVLPTSTLSPADAARLVYFSSEEEEEMRREAARRPEPRLPKSASVRFSRDAVTITREEDAELSTSDYASAERVNRLPGAWLGFSNPHYLGPDVRALGAALTPDSGVAPADMELAELRRPAAAPRLALLLLGGREPSHPALMHTPLSLWTYNLG
ncbi:uncharacterized protein LOC126371937 [Pectinophora gossypiella]|uniref:uncharacterized protein LOC126371937 n=1 Tax=Pectinophora gossypiella TaxID=13191 RepID=UPI00214F4038|nr:uncharacterized protein LOC126371937 [Pectinophora gossypiella]